MSTSILHLASASSTNDVAREQALAGAAHGWAVRADVQTAGRGQRGHDWASPQGGLYLSVILRPGVAPRLMSGLPAACGLGAAQALESLGVANVRIKWPNDLVVNNAKLGGMLTEAGWSDDGAFAVCGIGINVSTPTLKNPLPYALPTVGLDACLSKDSSVPSMSELALSVRDGMLAAVDRWVAALIAAGAAATPMTGIMDVFYDRMAHVGEYVALIDREGKPYAAGTLTGLDMWGRALVRLDDGGDGSEKAFDPAQVSIRPIA